MLKILICSSNKENAKSIKNAFVEVGQSEVSHAKQKEEVIKHLSLFAFDTILIDIPFTFDKHEISFLLSLQERFQDVTMILLIPNAHLHRIRERVERYGMFALGKPIVKDNLYQLLNFIRVNSYRLQKYKTTQQTLLAKIEEIKQVDRAKCLLMENEYMSEAKAHRHIEKQAMDSRLTRKEVAKEIIDKYEAMQTY